MLLNHRYLVLTQLGEGGFGTTYLAEDTHLPSRRKCVVKELRPQPSIPFDLAQERFAREAVILEQLGEGHPQIPKLFAYFSEAEKLYLVQEYVEGQTLAALNRETPIDERTAVTLLTQTLPILQYIHSQGIIHRDIKPDNIIVRSQDQQPVLIDFGAVKETLSVQLNESGVPMPSIVIGTMGYMAMEQAKGRPTFASDVYSLGMTWVSLLTQSSPNVIPSSPATGEVFWQSEMKQPLSPRFQAVLDKAVAPLARDRYASADEMLQDLQRLQDIPETIVPPSVYPATSSVQFEPTVLDRPTPPAQSPVPAVKPPAVAPSETANGTASDRATKKKGGSWTIAACVLSPFILLALWNLVLSGLFFDNGDLEDDVPNDQQSSTACIAGDNCEFSLAPGFFPNPTTGTGLTGGPIAGPTIAGVERTVAGPCTGFFPEDPSHLVFLDGRFNHLAIGVTSTVETALIVKDLNSDDVLCNVGADPYVYSRPWHDGEYAVYVGSISPDDQGDRYQLSIYQEPEGS